MQMMNFIVKLKNKLDNEYWYHTLPTSEKKEYKMHNQKNIEFMTQNTKVKYADIYYIQQHNTSHF